MSQRLTSFSAEQLLPTLISLPAAGSWLVGLSGGADSTALLHTLVQLKEQLNTPFRAVHVNHGLHPDSNQWQQHCETLCQQWSVPLTCIDVQITRTGQGLEAEAREKRYAAIASILQADEALLTAHHQDDQAETLLLNLMRGSGVDGLSAMPASKQFGDKQLFRPLLNSNHQALLDYLSSNQIKWIEDPSNQNIDQDRNFIRNSLLPLLEKQFSGATKRLLLTQQAMAESRTLLESMADRQIKDSLLHSQVLSLSDELLDNPALFKLTIRHWLKKNAVASLPNRQLNDLCNQLQHVTSGSQTSVRWAGTCLRFYQNCLWLQKNPEVAACEQIDWPENQTSLELNQPLGTLSLVSDKPIKLPGAISVSNRTRHFGLSLDRGNHHQSLKNLFQSASVPVWLRDCIPLLLIDDQLAAVGDWATSKSFASWLSQNHVKFTWQPGAPLLQYLTQQQRHRARLT